MCHCSLKVLIFSRWASLKCLWSAFLSGSVDVPCLVIVYSKITLFRFFWYHIAELQWCVLQRVLHMQLVFSPIQTYGPLCYFCRLCRYVYSFFSTVVFWLAQMFSETQERLIKARGHWTEMSSIFNLLYGLCESPYTLQLLQNSVFKAHVASEEEITWFEVMKKAFTAWFIAKQNPWHRRSKHHLWFQWKTWGANSCLLRPHSLCWLLQ